MAFTLYFDISPLKKATQLLLYLLSIYATGVHDTIPQDIRTHPFYSYILKYQIAVWWLPNASAILPDIHATCVHNTVTQKFIFSFPPPTTTTTTTVLDHSMSAMYYH